MVLEPESLRDEIRAEAESLLNRYEMDKKEKPLKA
jgi:predicted DNA-binding transcriptional regulator YafY